MQIVAVLLVVVLRIHFRFFSHISGRELASVRKDVVLPCFPIGSILMECKAETERSSNS